MLAEKMLAKAVEEHALTARSIMLWVLLLQTQGNHATEILQLLQKDTECQLGNKEPLLTAGRERDLLVLRCGQCAVNWI